MGRRSVQALVAMGVLAGSLALAAQVRAAGEVVVAVSPSEVDVDEPVEVLVRTFQVVDRGDLSLPFASPIAPYPVPSGVWNILYPWPEYPFDVVAQREGEADIRVKLTRDPADSTLWRGQVTFPTPGQWTVWVRNFTGKEPGSTAAVTVRGRSGAVASPPPGTGTSTGPAAMASAPTAIIAALGGLLVGAFVALSWRRRSTI